MLRSQKDVDKHVQEAFRNISNDKERNLRCYNVAKLYHKVGDYQSTKQYVELYLREQPNAAGAHKLLGQAQEALKDYPKALEEYKCSLRLESRQPDLVLKVCELLVETKMKLSAGEAKYWRERAEEVSGNHQTVFRFKEYLLEDGSGDQAQLAQLVEKEIEARPHDHVPRTRLLNLYLDSKRVLDAYKYAVDLEARCLFRGSIQWYSCIVEVLKAYQREVKNLDFEFYVNQLCVLERHAALCFGNHRGGHTSLVSNALFDLDQACFEASKLVQKGGEQLLQECVRHVSGQLCFHLGAALLGVGKQGRTGWKEWTPYAWALMNLAYTTPATVDFASHSSTSSGREKHRKLIKLWKEDCAFRCSQAGHILVSLNHERIRFTQLNGGNWREKVFQVIFAAQVKGRPGSEKSSFYMSSDKFADILETSPSPRDVILHDDLSQQQRPDSLHALVWLGLRYMEPSSKQVSLIGTTNVLPHRLLPNFACHVFEELKLSTGVLETAGVETLSRLDVDTFLYATVFCAAASQDERHYHSVVGEGRPSVLPVDLTEPLCTEAQAKWWFNAYRLHVSKSRSDIGEVRMTVTRGLEVVRLLGNHGMDVRLIVLLAKFFSEKASALSTPKDNVPDISKRAQLFWQRAINLLERMAKNQPLRMPENPLFSYGGKELTPSDIRVLLEEGRFFMACRLMKEEKYEKAIEVFEELKNPYASFYEGLIYKKLADAELESLGGVKVSSEIKSKYVILLQKSRSALHLTLDRLRSPQNAGTHPLNVELEQHLIEVENCLVKEETDVVYSGVNRFSHEGVLNESFASNRFEDSLNHASHIVNTSMHHTLLSNLGLANGQSPSRALTSTPFKSKQVFESSINLNASAARTLEARPSPERLDAQLKRMSVTTDAVMQVVVEQNRQMLDSNKTMMDALEKTRVAVEELQKQMSDLKVEVGKLKQCDSHPQAHKNVDYMVPQDEEYDYDVATPQLRSLQVFPPAAPYASYPVGQAYNYDNRSSSNTVPIPGTLPPPLFPQGSRVFQMPTNVDPSIFLASYYPGLGLNSAAAGTAGIGLPSTIPGVIPGTPSSSLAAPTPANMAIPSQMESVASSDSYRRSNSLMGTPIVSHPNLANPAIDLSAAASQSPHLQAYDPSAQRFSMAGQQGPSSLGKTTVASSVASESVPHNFQISMPLQPTIPTTESLEKSLSPLKPFATDSILPNVPMPAFSAVSSRQSDIKPRRLSAGGNDTFTEDADYNPCADFKPIIPLPEEITVTTGEEDETPLYVRRAKLFRFVGGEWKERGVGDMKILKHNVTGKPRILMRREQVHKICANHYILPEMELSAQTGTNGRAWTWAANDFTDGEARIEKLCVRFKTVEDAEQFKDVFDEARKLSNETTPVKASAPAASTAKSDNKTTTTSTVQATSTPGKVQLGGFSFISPPVLKPVERQEKTTPGKDKETSNSVSKPSPFAGFSFTPSSSSNVFGSSTQSSASIVPTKPVFGKDSPSPAVSTSSVSLFGSKPAIVSSLSSSTPVFSTGDNVLDFAALAAQNKSSEVGKKDATFKGFEGAGSKVFGGTVSSSTEVVNKSVEQECGDAEEFEPTAVFNPVIPLPSIVEVKTGEENEEVIFEERAKLLRFDLKEWKERGIGKMKVLKNRGTGKVRLLMRREQVLKVCCNHFITPDIQFKPLLTSDKAITWSAQDYAEGEVRVEVFALRFKTPELMHTFKEVIENVQKELKENPTGSPAAALQTFGKKDDKPLSELFKPKQGSWECSGCYTRNDAEKLSCLCCSSPKPGYKAADPENKPVPSSQFTFGIKPGSSAADTSNAVTGFKFGDISTISTQKQPSLAELFKPKEGSWACQDCYTRCDADKVKCVACEKPKPGHENDAQASKSSFSFGTKSTPSNTFSFGIPDPKSESKSFSFSTLSSAAPQIETKSTFQFGAPSSTSSDSMKGFSFGSSTLPSAPTVTSSGFVFGTTLVTSDAPSHASSEETQPLFGSPHGFDFHIKKASSPVKSPGKSPGAPSGEEESGDEEEVEENTDVGDFKPVVPLPDKVPLLTGEEDETVLYGHRAKLFRFLSGEWKERGLGDIKVLCHNVTNKPRLLMRREQVLKICLNHFILSDLEMMKKDEKTWMWAAQDFSEGVLSTEKFACRFKTAEIADDFKRAIDNAKALTVLPSPSSGGDDASGSTANDGSTLKTFSFKLPSNKPGVVRSLFGSSEASLSTSDEVEVVYEAKVSPEEKAAALKLKLPENFYLYKQAPSCTGCAGCEKDSESDQGDDQSPSIITAAKADSSSTLFNAPAAVFGSGSSLFSTSSFSSPSSINIFGGSSSQSSATPIFSGSLFGTGALSSGPGSTAVNSHSTAFPILGSKPSALETKDEKSVPFLPVSNSPSFSSLAATSPSSNIFKPKESRNAFSFAGAGSKVFGSVGSEAPSAKQTTNDDEGDSGGEQETAGEVETHDPHFEPIIAMPDMVEVRTGEEDEEKLFCQRAKLFRYDSNLKEWKERGVGEIKILKHPVNGTFRLLLRREQVHKVVLNQRIDPETQLKPLSTSDQAWCWGGINHAEEAGVLEELAVRFKNSELAQEFRTTFEECQKFLAKGTANTTPIPGVGSTLSDVKAAGVAKEAAREDTEDEDEEEDEDDYDEDGEILFEANAYLVKGEQNVEGSGILRVISSSDGTHYVEVEDDSTNVLCRAPIMGDAEVQRQGNVCSWKSIDLVDDGEHEEKFAATFDTETDADSFEEIYARITLEIVERTYDYVEEQED